MRILHVTQRYLPAIGGSEMHLAEISQRLAAEGHEVTVVTTDALDFESIWDARARRIAEPCAWIDGVRVLRFPIRYLPVSTLTYPALRRLLWMLTRFSWSPLQWAKRVAQFTPWTPELAAWLGNTEEDFDLVAGMMIVFEPLMSAAQLYAKRRGRPFVIYPLTHLGVGPSPGSDALSRSYTMRHQIDIVANSDYLIANNQDEANFYQQHGMAAERMAVIGPGVDLEHLAGGNAARFRHTHRLEATTVGVISTMAYDKGVFHVIEALRTLWRQGCAVHLVLAGAMMEPFRRYLDTLSPAERSRIIVLGTVDHQTKLDLLDALDILALPSRTDSFGIVYLEAWAYGKPVIGAQAWGVKTVIDDGQDGLLVPFGDVSALVDAIRTLAENPELRLSMGERGRRKVVAHHTWGHKYSRVRQIYARLVENGDGTA